MDRIVEFLTRQNGLAEHTSRESDVAVVLRATRDDLVMAWQAGEIYDLLGAERWLNARIRSLGVETVTGDTTEDQP